MAFALGGMANEAITDHNAIDTTGMDRNLKAEYFMASRQMYSYISNNYDGYPEAQEIWIEKAADSQNKALPLLDHTTPDTAATSANTTSRYTNTPRPPPSSAPL